MNTKTIFGTVIAIMIVVGIGLVMTGQVVIAPLAPDVRPIAIYENSTREMITVDSLRAGDTIKSPMTLSGTAFGNWYFEGSFPIEIRNAVGTVIGRTIGVAQGEWMTASSVPFHADVTFTTTATSGSIVLRNDNPSGDPIRDRALIIPIKFGN